MDYTIRKMRSDDYDDAYSLWRTAEGVCLEEEDSREAIELYLRRNRGLCFVATVNGQLVGTILCGHEGRRGILRHLVVAETYRGKGIARTLVRKCLASLASQGIRKCNTFVLDTNLEGSQFWDHMGWYLLEDNFRIRTISV